MNLMPTSGALWLALAGLMATAAFPHAEPEEPESRRVLSLDGVWEVAQGQMDITPVSFDHTVPVPGFLDMAEPAVNNVGAPDTPPHEAFWYRRTFRVEGPCPASARLYISKAAYGKQVWLNGQLVGEHWPCYTPVEYEVAPLLKADGQENELLVRLGASRWSVPLEVHNGYDGEKKLYLPGIYDSVFLTLTGEVRIERVQAVPDVAVGAVRAHVVVLNGGGSNVDAVIQCDVLERIGGRAAGQVKSAKKRVAAGGETVFDVTIPIDRPNLWSPESPFLYDLDVRVGSDQTTTTFGLRSFSFDCETGLPLLNGVPRYLRGTNVTFFRFSEDPRRGGLPWTEEWVRRLHRQFKSMHWDTIRYCIGFPPELWYRIADEEGLMIQDEYPIWGMMPDVTTDQLEREFTDWIHERANHPSVVIWDTSNETLSPVIAPAIARVRGLDQSARPWENSMNGPPQPGDCWESHPYNVFRGFRLSNLEELSPFPESPVNPREYSEPASIIINEYGSMWVGRRGLPLPSGEPVYQELFGPNPTPEQRMRTYAYYSAALTEFWRAGREAIGVLHFCGLAYGKPDTVTSDCWYDVENLRFEPHFAEWVRDAFAPVGVMLATWPDDETVVSSPGGAAAPWPAEVLVTNDLPTSWTGRIRVRLLRDERLVFEESRDCTVESLRQARLEFEPVEPIEPASYRLEALLQDEANPRPVRSFREFRVISRADKEAVEGLAWARPVTASSTYREPASSTVRKEYKPQFVVDGDSGTRWSSEFSEPQWLVIDLERACRLEQVEIEWQDAYAQAYTLRTSLDGEAWTEVYHTEDSTGGSETIPLAEPAHARYLRLDAQTRATPFGVSIFDLHVRGRESR